MEKENKTPVVAKPSIFKRPIVQSLIGIVVVIALFVTALVYKDVASSVSIDTSVILAPVIAIGPQSAGILQSVFVKPGEAVTVGQSVAAVGTEVLYAKVNGLVISTQNNPGQLFSAGAAVVSMIDPSALRVVGTIDEDKGLSQIRVGDPVSFTVDAFGSKEFSGIVDEISPTSNDNSVVFSISDKRPTRQFNIKVLFDVAAHPEFKNGMSAKMKVFPK